MYGGNPMSDELIPIIAIIMLCGAIAGLLGALVACVKFLRKLKRQRATES